MVDFDTMEKVSDELKTMNSKEIMDKVAQMGRDADVEFARALGDWCSTYNMLIGMAISQASNNLNQLDNISDKLMTAKRIAKVEQRLEMQCRLQNYIRGFLQ